VRQARPQSQTAPAPATGGAAEYYRTGLQLRHAGQIAAAMDMLRAAIRADPGHAESHLALGALLLQAGHVADAATVLSAAAALRPGSAQIHRDLGAAYDALNLPAQAIDAYRKAVALAPRLGDVHHRLAELLLATGQQEDAADSLDRAAAIKPKTTQARLYRADAQMLRGDMPSAETWARRAVLLEPADPAAHGTLAGLLYAQGRFAEAAAHFETALRRNPCLGKAWDGLVHCRDYTAADTAIAARMRDILQRRDLAEADRTIIHFALGKVLQDAGQYAEAMHHFDQGNALRGHGRPFDRAGFADLVDRTIRLFTPDFLARPHPAANPDERPIFIVGMYRSGTTLAEQIVSSHDMIAAGGERTVLGETALTPEALAPGADPAPAAAAIAAYLAATSRRWPDAARVTDKLPFNFLRLGAIHALLPNARIIHCRRDPIDTCLSIYTTLFNTNIAFAARKDDLAFAYRHYQRLMAHWRAVLPTSAYMEVEYESLIADREAQTRRMIDFTGLDWQQTCLTPEQNPRPIATASAWQARQPVYATSIQRWRRYEPWLGELLQLRG
jgi:tetratricopeptide (TPR) repeat protein